MKQAIIIFFSLALMATACKSSRIPREEVPEPISSNTTGTGPELRITFLRGEAHNHPLMAIWAETLDGEYIQTFFVARSIARGVFEHGDPSTGKWMPGEIRRPAALPVWSHNRGVKEKDGLYVPTPETAIPDAYSGPTPQKSFVLDTRLDKPGINKFYVLFEINQTWDWNEYWTNNKYPDDEDYKTSCQPSLVYRALVDLTDGVKQNSMELIGRGHYSGKDGKIYTDLETMTTAKNITRSIVVTEK